MIRTDLAMEAQVLSKKETLPEGVILKNQQRYGLEATVVEIRSRKAAKAMEKPMGTYITLELGRVLRREKDSFDGAVTALSGYLREFLKLPMGLPVLVAGLGNREVTPDALGPLTADHVLVTRHLKRELPTEFGRFRAVSVSCPGVLGTTGLESAETVRALVHRTGAAAVIAVDAIAARDTSRLCSTVQLSDTGIAPGSGIGNLRLPLNEETLGVPVISMGVPTVTDAGTLAADLLMQLGREADPEALRCVSGGMIVTTSDIDRRVREISRVLSYSINSALQPHLSLEDLGDLTF